MTKSLPKRNNYLRYELCNSGLSSAQYDSLFNPAIKEYSIIYSGDFNHLDYLIQQLASCKNKDIRLIINDVNIDYSCILPLDILSSNTNIVFANKPGQQSNFYNYLLSMDYNLLKNTDCDYIDQIINEKKIQDKFIKDFSELLFRRRKVLSDYSKKDLMDVVFNYVIHNYPYDNSITASDGSATRETYSKGGTAYAVYTRGRGICEGRSKLVKLFANNKVLQVPCYIVDGLHIDYLLTGDRHELGHMWNEFVDSDGIIYEYDTSYGLKCKLEDLSDNYEIHNHEPEVKRLIK